jgi:hypothetical protein
LGIGPNPQSPIPNPQSPIPNPHKKVIFITIKKLNFLLRLFIYLNSVLAMAVYRETFNSKIISNERENKLLDFDKKGRHFQILIEHKKREKNFNFLGKSLKNLY